MANPDLIKTYVAQGAIPAYHLVKFGTVDYSVTVGTDATGLVGVTTEIAAADGEAVDIIHDDIAFVQLGGTVTRGDPITGDANGCGMHAILGQRSVGIAIQSGVVGDVIEVLLAISANVVGSSGS
jgi:hypothetical protein